MLVAGIIFSVVFLGAIIYFAVSPKSSKLLRLAAIIALGLIVISLVISGIFIIKGPSKDPALISLPVFVEQAPQGKSSFRITDLLIIFAFLLALSLVIVKALKDQKKAMAEVPKLEKNLNVSNDDDLETETAEDDSDEESFNLDDMDLK